MMTIIMVAMQNSILSIESVQTGWKADESLKQTQPQCVAIDTLSSNVAYCGTFADGLWKTEDFGHTWNRTGRGEITSNDVTSVSISRSNNGNKIFAGTEPTALYRSHDRGESWQKMVSLNNLKSSRSWSFPPRPWTSHVRWIEADSNNPGYLYVAIEAGALVQSHDGGETWIDRVSEGPYDSHTLATHQMAPKCLYSSAGDGYFESPDCGQTWEKPRSGLEHHYLYGLAVDSENPNNIIVSASQTAIQAHSIEHANSLIYKKSSEDRDAQWMAISDGLPGPSGTTISRLAADPTAGIFYAVNNRGIFSSIDSGVSWRTLDISWPKEYLFQHPSALAVAAG
jgi:photosystem II stability/assembly factor-like uncharacterized protein